MTDGELEALITEMRAKLPADAYERVQPFLLLGIELLEGGHPLQARLVFGQIITDVANLQPSVRRDQARRSPGTTSRSLPEVVEVSRRRVPPLHRLHAERTHRTEHRLLGVAEEHRRRGDVQIVRERWISVPVRSNAQE
jgi:hypothetical protein